jgi:hypothetical protein
MNQPSKILIISSLIILAVSCISEEPMSENPKKEITEKHQWQLSEFSVKAKWDSYDQDVPFLYPSIPDNIPDKFIVNESLQVGDQGSQASGSAWAAGFTAFTYLIRSHKKEPAYVCSPAYIFNQLNRGINKVIEIQEVAEFLVREGCADLKYMPYREYDHFYTPTAEARRDANAHKLSGYARVDFLDMSQVQGHLLQGSPVIITLRVYDNFLLLENEVWQSPVGRFLGRHTVAVIGYDNKKEMVYIHNSAGGKWAKNGRAAIPYSWFLRLTEKAYVLY